jgi:protein-disulfide isomerase
LQGAAFFGFIDLLFATQQSWARSSDPIGALQELAKQAGMDEEKSGACLEDEVAITRILEQRKYAADELSVNSTPSFIINGEKFAGARDYSEFDSFLKGLL